MKNKLWNFALCFVITKWVNVKLYEFLCKIFWIWIWINSFKNISWVCYTYLLFFSLFTSRQLFYSGYLNLTKLLIYYVGWKLKIALTAIFIIIASKKKIYRNTSTYKRRVCVQNSDVYWNKNSNIAFVFWLIYP